MDRVRLSFVASLVVFSASLGLIYFDKDLENIYTRIFQALEHILRNRLWIFTAISTCLGIWFYRCTWRLVDEETFAPITIPNPINERQRDIHEARYNHLNAEITRYRDLVWKITAFSWAIYYALIRFAEGFTIPVVSSQNLPKFSLPIGWFLIFCMAIAFIASIFHAFCEIMAVRNQERRRSLETAMGLIDPNWAHQATLEHPGRMGFRFSVIVFGLLIWTPPLTMLVLLANQR